MHDTNLEERLRSVLRTEGDSLPLTITTDELERRLPLRRRARNGQRLSLMAAGIAVLAVGTMVALSNGWLRGTNVATPPSPSPSASASVAPSPSPSPDAVVTPSPVASVDPLAGLPVIEQDPAALDHYDIEDPGDPTSVESRRSRYLDGAPMEARETSIRVACLGSDALLEWGVYPETTNVGSESVVCDGTVQSFRFDLSSHQPMIGQSLVFQSTPATPFRLVVETVALMNDPRPTALPSFAIPDGTVLDDLTMEGGVTNGDTVALKAGNVAPRGAYRVAMVCLGDGTAQWSIGDLGERDFVATGVVECDGAALAWEANEGIPQGETQVWVYTDPANDWRIVITDTSGAPLGTVPSFIAPPLIMWAGADMEGAGVAGLGRCVSHGEGGDSCAGVWSARNGSDLVSIPVGSDVTFGLEDGWTMRCARVTAVLRDVARTNPDAAGQEVAYVPDGGDRITVTLADLAAGEWVVRVSCGGEKDGDIFGGYYDIPVLIGG